MFNRLLKDSGSCLVPRYNKCYEYLQLYNWSVQLIKWLNNDQTNPHQLCVNKSLHVNYDCTGWKAQMEVYRWTHALTRRHPRGQPVSSAELEFDSYCIFLVSGCIYFICISYSLYLCNIFTVPKICMPFYALQTHFYISFTININPSFSLAGGKTCSLKTYTEKLDKKEKKKQ